LWRFKVKFEYANRAGLAGVAGVVLAAAACGEFVTSPQLQTEDPLAFRVPEAGEVCVYLPFEQPGPATFTIVGDPAVGTYPAGSPFTVNPMGYGQCTTVWLGTGGDATTLTVTEDPQPGWRVTRIDLLRGGDLVQVNEFPVGPATVSFAISAGTDALLKVYTAPFYTPTNGEGCTPGHWRQPQHAGSWPLAQSDLFLTHFGRNAFPGATLLEVVWLGGGGIRALGRHAVAALLNALSPDVDYGLTAGEVVTLFQQAFDSPGQEDVEETKDVFVALNEAGCPL
jgi:hypothetical protein